MVAENYDHIWDCCCDHGFLGAALLSKNAAPYIHFVDIVAELMHTLEKELSRFFPGDSSSASLWQVHCVDVSTLPLQNYRGKHLVIIAGVGGDLMARFIHAISQNHTGIEIDFLLCPVHHQFTLRQQLIKLDFSLLTEALIIESQRFYEVLLVSSKPDASSAINPVGSLIWQSHTPEQLKIMTDYLASVLAHYQRVQLSSNSDVQHIIDAYRAIRI